MDGAERITERRPGPLGALLAFVLEERLVVAIATVAVVLGGIAVAPFDWKVDWLPRSPVAVDAIPDLGENQQIVFTDWMGRAPQDVEDQVTYPLTVQLLGLPGVRDVRSTSMFGFSTISVIFEDGVDFYWARSRIIEKLNSLPPGVLPAGVQPGLGPDATGLGQVYWYTLEGRDPQGRPVGGWDLHELRSIQDYYVRHALLAAEGISEVAAIGGFVREYHVDVDPDAARAAGVTLDEIFQAVRNSNLDIGARTTEINRVEYVVRGTGFVKSTADIASAVVRAGEGLTPIRVSDVATVSLGPAERRGALDVGGAEAVGGVVVVREGYNPLQAIANVKAKTEELAPGLPVRAVVDWTRTTPAAVEAFATLRGFQPFADAALDQDAWLGWLRATPEAEWPDWVTTSQVTVVPFYDRTGLIHETLGTLNDALLQQILVTTLVVIVMLLHLRVSLVVSAMLPLAVLLAFLAMRGFGVDANVVALAGIAIAIGTIVDMGIILSENVLRHLEEAPPAEPRIDVVYRAATEVGPAVVTAIATTVISFLPVFAMTGAEGKLFTPLAFTKTFVLAGAALIALTLVPVALYVTLARRRPRGGPMAAVAAAVRRLASRVGVAHLPPGRLGLLVNLAAAVAVVVVLARVWEPVGAQRAFLVNLLFTVLLVGGVLGAFRLFEGRYERILRWTLANRRAFLAVPGIMILLGLNVWLGFDRVFGVVPRAAEAVGVEPSRVRTLGPWSWAAHAFPGLGREFMPALDEGSFLWMPTLMPHASMGEALEIMALQNQAFEAIPEVASVVGKIGRAESALDPAPISMFETVINYKPEYATDASGRRQRQWRDHIHSPQDIWDEIVAAGRVPGSTSAPKLQPIETRLVMLQTGMRAPMGIKVRGPDLETIEATAVRLEALLREVPAVEAATVNAERAAGKPYLEIEVDREAAARYGLSVVEVQNAISVAIGGAEATTTVEGRERYGVRVRYPRELRGDPEEMGRVLVAAPALGGGAMAAGGGDPILSGTGMGGGMGSGGLDASGAGAMGSGGGMSMGGGAAPGGAMGSTDGGTSGGGSGQLRSAAAASASATGLGAPPGPPQIPLSAVTHIRYVRGPEMIRSENTFPVAYVTFGARPGVAEVEVVEQAQAYLAQQVRSGALVVPAGVSWTFAGSYENQLHAARTLRVVLPLALAIIFLILYFQFRSVTRTAIVFSGIAVAWAGGFIMIWLFGQPWFADFGILGANLRETFQLHSVNLSVAVWVGFLALFGIAVDDGVVMMTYLRQRTDQDAPATVEAIREATVQAGLRRVRPCLMTSATTILALMPVLTATGRGSDIMIPMAIPSVGGMTLVLLTMFTVPVLFAWSEERKLARTHARTASAV